MTVYYVSILLVILTSGLAQAADRRSNSGPGEKRKSKAAVFLLFLTSAILSVVAGLRYEVGTDFGAYFHADEIFGGHAWESLKTLNEPIIAIFTDLISLITDVEGAYTFFFSLFTIGLSTYVLFRDTEDYVFAILLFIFTGCWHGTFNGVRQYMAATFVLLGYRYIYEKKMLKYFFFIFLAYCTHVSAIIMVIPYFFLRNRITFINILILVLGTAVVSYNYETIFSFIGMLKEEEIVMNTYATNSVNILRILVNCAPAVLALVLCIHNGGASDEQAFFINILFFNAAAMVAASNSAYLARIGIYTGILVPIAMEKLIRFKNSMTTFIVRSVIIVLFAIFWYVDVSTPPALNEFKWVWER